MTPEEKPSSAVLEAAEEAANPIYEPGEHRAVFCYGFRRGARWQAAQVAEAVGKLEEASKRICLEADALRGQGVSTSNLLRISVMLDDCAALLRQEGKK